MTYGSPPFCITNLRSCHVSEKFHNKLRQCVCKIICSSFKILRRLTSTSKSCSLDLPRNFLGKKCKACDCMNSNLLVKSYEPSGPLLRELIPVFVLMKRLGLLLLLLDGMLVHRSISSGSPNSLLVPIYSWVERGTVRVKCLAQEHNTMTRPGLEPGTLDPESSALTTRPPCLLNQNRVP